MKYLESVQHSAWSGVTTAVPLVPLVLQKPVSHSRSRQWAGGFSLWCGSVPEIITVLTPAFAISARSAARYCFWIFSIKVTYMGFNTVS